MTPNCDGCANQYQGADLIKRCRINSLMCSNLLAQDCDKFRYEPGSDADEQPWYAGAWCEGRGD